MDRTYDEMYVFHAVSHTECSVWVWRFIWHFQHARYECMVGTKTMSTGIEWISFMTIIETCFICMCLVGAYAITSLYKLNERIDDVCLSFIYVEMSEFVCFKHDRREMFLDFFVRLNVFSQSQFKSSHHKQCHE